MPEMKVEAELMESLTVYGGDDTPIATVPKGAKANAYAYTRDAEYWRVAWGDVVMDDVPASKLKLGATLSH